MKNIYNINLYIHDPHGGTRDISFQAASYGLIYNDNFMRFKSYKENGKAHNHYYNARYIFGFNVSEIAEKPESDAPQ